MKHLLKAPWSVKLSYLWFVALTMLYIRLMMLYHWLAYYTGLFVGVGAIVIGSIIAFDVLERYAYRSVGVNFEKEEDDETSSD